MAESLGRWEQRECRSGEQWEGETNRISAREAETQSNEGVSAALQGCFLSHYLFWVVKKTQGHSVQVPVYLSSISDLSPLSLPLRFLCLCVIQKICACLLCESRCTCAFCVYLHTWARDRFVVTEKPGVLNWLNPRYHSRHGGVAYGNGNELLSGHQVFPLWLCARVRMWLISCV